MSQDAYNDWHLEADPVLPTILLIPNKIGRLHFQKTYPKNKTKKSIYFLNI